MKYNLDTYTSNARQRPYMAVYCLVSNGPKILMLQRTGTRYADGFWSIPAGHVDDGEPFLHAATRELLEETGLSVRPECWSLLTLMHRCTDQRTIVDVFLKARSFTGELLNLEPDKHANLGFYDLTDLPGPIVDYVAIVLGQIAPDRESPSLIEHGWGS